ncbi:MAG: glycoside hydrolase family 2 TIM barrel-domain containing protein [Opitutales bacterium]
MSEGKGIGADPEEGAQASPLNQTIRVYLTGKGPSDAVDWEFFCSSGRNRGRWTSIPLPSNWEQHEFGDYNYGYDLPPEKHDEVGTYRTAFTIPEAWKNRHVRLVFEGAMSETSIRVNGQATGAVNQGGYLPFRYPLNGKHFRGSLVPPVLKYGESNELEVRVAKRPSNHSLDVAERSADYWVFGGIYRPVYLESLPLEFIDRVAIDAAHDGRISLEAYIQDHSDLKTKDVAESGELNFVDYIEAQIFTEEGEPFGDVLAKQIGGPTATVRLQAQLNNPAMWTPETPNLYRLRTRIYKSGDLVHERFDSFGFRTIEIRPREGLFLNGERLLVKGVNRNGMDPYTARAIDPASAWDDARMIKSMNANLVRAHLPPSKAFMEACDRLGLLFIIELSTWKYPAIDSPVARELAYRLVTHYHNHPSLIMWANGNEGGFNRDIDPIFGMFDLQNRPVIHPWAVFNGLNALHYPSYAQLEAALRQPWLVLPTEFLHGVFDGGHAAGLSDYWDLMRGSPNAAGGVLWCWADAGLFRTDSKQIDTEGNYSADGIVGPMREKEASFYGIREIWSPIHIAPEGDSSTFGGSLSLENRFSFKNADTCTLHWSLIDYPHPRDSNPGAPFTKESGQLRLPSLPPGESGMLGLPLPPNWRDYDSLAVRVKGEDGTELMKWAWAIEHTSDRLADKESDWSSSIVEISPFVFRVGRFSYKFSPQTGQLLSCQLDQRDIGFGNGPRLYAQSPGSVSDFDSSEWTVRLERDEHQVVIASTQPRGESSFKWTLSACGSLSLEYIFQPPADPLEYLAVGMDLREEAIQSKRWLGKGPHRIWANRQKGPQFSLWKNPFNDTVPGESWDYPAFKGIFGDVHWMDLSTTSGVSLLVELEEAADLGVLRPKNANHDGAGRAHKYGPVKASWAYPKSGGLFFFHKLPAIGSKLNHAADLGPQSEPQVLSEPIRGKVTFSWIKEAEI